MNKQTEFVSGKGEITTKSNWRISSKSGGYFEASISILKENPRKEAEIPGTSLLMFMVDAKTNDTLIIKIPIDDTLKQNLNELKIYKYFSTKEAYDAINFSIEENYIIIQIFAGDHF